jgi:MFS family permease
LSVRAASQTRRTFAGLIAAAMTAYLSIGIVIAVLPVYVKGPLGGSDVTVGIVLGAVPVGMLLTRPLAGRMIDHRGPRGVIIVALLGASLAAALYPFASSSAMLLPARFLHGAAEACVYTGGLVWVVGMVAPERRGRAIGLYGLCVWSGFTVGPPVGQIAHQLGGFNAVWALAAVPPAIGALVISRLPPPPASPEHEGRRQLLPRGSIRPGIGGGMAGIGIAAINGFVVLLCIDRGFGQTSGAIAIALFASATLVGRLVAGGLPDRLGPRRTMVIAVTLGASGQALIAVAPGWWAVGVGCVLFGFCWTLLFPALAMLVVDAVEPSQRGAGLAAYSSFFDLGFGVGAPLLGLIASELGYGALYVTAAVVVSCSLVSVAGRRVSGLEPDGR